MRHKGVPKEETRKKMLEAVGRGFRESGFDGAGVDGLSKAAGVTSGAFYAHFGSKINAFDCALEAGLDAIIETVPVYQADHGADWVAAFADYYMSREQRDNVSGGCAMATLLADVIRSKPEIQKAFEAKLDRIAELVANGLTGRSREDRLARAWAMLSTLVGGLNLARALKSREAADKVADAARLAAIKAAGRARERPLD